MAFKLVKYWNWEKNIGNWYFKYSETEIQWTFTRFRSETRKAQKENQQLLLRPTVKNMLNSKITPSITMYK